MTTPEILDGALQQRRFIQNQTQSKAAVTIKGILTEYPLTQPVNGKNCRVIHTAQRQIKSADICVNVFTGADQCLNKVVI